MKKLKNVMWGIALIVVGLIMGGNALGIIDVNLFFDGWWTLFIIIPCLTGIFSDGDKTASLFGLIIGIALLLASQDVIEYDVIWKLALPVILVVLGISFIVKSSFNAKTEKEIKNIKSSKNQSICSAIFAGHDEKFNGEEFKGANLTAIFGGIEYDLRNAIINDNQVIKATTIFGGIDILVPKDVKIKVASTSIFGGVDDERKEETTTENAKIIYINATCIFGGIDVK